MNSNLTDWCYFDTSNALIYQVFKLIFQSKHKIDVQKGFYIEYL